MTHQPPPPPVCTYVPPCGKCWACAANEAIDAGVDVLTVLFRKTGKEPEAKPPKPGDSGPTKGSG